MTEMTRRKLISTSLVAGSGLIVGWKAVASQSSTPTASPGASPEASPAASPAAGGSAAITLNAIDINWEPKELSIPANTDVTITVMNVGLLQHNFLIDDPKVDSGLIDAGNSADVTINAPAGTYEFYCSVAGHKEAGMVGTLTVQ